jgi:hypothetical protein
LNRLEEAEAVSLRSLRIKQDSGAFSKFDILRGMFKLSKLYLLPIQARCCRIHNQKVFLELSEQTLGSSHPLVAMVARQLADLYNELGSSREAEQFYHRASAVQKNQFDNRSVHACSRPKYALIFEDARSLQRNLAAEQADCF